MTSYSKGGRAQNFEPNGVLSSYSNHPQGQGDQRLIVRRGKQRNENRSERRHRPWRCPSMAVRESPPQVPQGNSAPEKKFPNNTCSYEQDQRFRRFSERTGEPLLAGTKIMLLSEGPKSNGFQINARVVGVPGVLGDSSRGRRKRTLQHHERVRTVTWRTERK